MSQCKPRQGSEKQKNSCKIGEEDVDQNTSENHLGNQTHVKHLKTAEKWGIKRDKSDADIETSLRKTFDKEEAFE